MSRKIPTLLILVLFPAVLWAICAGATRTLTHHYGVWPGSSTAPVTVGLQYNAGSLSPSIVQSAISMWTQCGNAGIDFPKPLDNQTGHHNVTIEFINASSGTDQCGLREGNKITIYSMAEPTAGNQVSCEDPAIILAHELGHWYGLGHTTASSDCSSFIMYPAIGDPTGSRGIQSQECGLVREEWIMPNEPEHPNNPENEADSPETDPEDPTIDPTCDHPDCTPILIDTARNGFRLADVEDPVLFDIDADGALERLSWTEAGADEAFLYLDRNGNGKVEDGGELFGGATAQPPGEDRHGFRALAVFDQPAYGGNQDGWITAADAVFPRLGLWRDENRDGRSQPMELASLSLKGIVGLDLTPVVSNRRDRHGNLLRWAARVDFGNGQPLAAADVIFAAPE